MTWWRSRGNRGRGSLQLPAPGKLQEAQGNAVRCSDRIFLPSTVFFCEPETRQYKTVLQNLDTVDIEDSLASVVTRVSGNEARVVVEQHGKPVAAIISIEDLRRFAELEKASEDPWAIVDLVQAAFADVPIEEHEAEVDRVIAEICAEARAGAAHG